MSKMVFLQGPADEVWVDHTGQKLPVGALAEQHLKNIVRKFIRDIREGRLVYVPEDPMDDGSWPPGTSHYGKLE